MTDFGGMAPWNAALRLGIELAALVGLATGGWSLGRGPYQWVLAMGLPLLAAAIWGSFRVPGDPGPAPIAVPGWVRLVIEAVVLGGGAAGFAVAFGSIVWITYVAIVVFHYAAAADRIRRLLAL